MCYTIYTFNVKNIYDIVRQFSRFSAIKNLVLKLKIVRWWKCLDWFCPDIFSL